MHGALYGAMVGVALMIATPALAKPWQQMTIEEGARARAAVEPFVLAAYDCIAGAIPGNPKAVAFARKKNWISAAAATSGSCERSVQQMIRSIDIAFDEQGEGARYLHTQFRAELPSNLARRVKLPAVPIAHAPISRPASPMNTEAEEAKRKLFDATEAKLLACFQREMLGLVPYSNESAETLATVILGKCRQFESEAVDLSVATYGYSRYRAQATVGQVMTRAKARLIERIVTVRAEAQKAVRTAPPANPLYEAPSERPTTSRSF